jgi:predicted acylesterase/phospholipase RssA
MNQILIPLLLGAFLVSFYYKRRFWLILFTILRRCWFPLFTCLIAIYIYGFSPQGTNIVHELDLGKAPPLRRVTTMLALWLWAYNCYKLSTTALSLLDNEKLFGNNLKLANRIEQIVPIVIGFCPFILSISIIYGVKLKANLPLLIYLAIVLFYFMIYLFIKSRADVKIGTTTVTRKHLHVASLYLFYGYRRMMLPLNQFVDRILDRNLEKLKPLEGGRADFRAHWKTNMNGEQIINWIAHIVLFICIAAAPYFFGMVFGPIGLIFIALSFYTVIGTIFVYMRDRFGFAVFPVVVIILLFSLTGDNNKSGIISDELPDNRTDLITHYHNWIDERSKTDDTIHVVLVAAEGGGLRSAYWTYAVMDQMRKDIPDFTKNVFGISGVSGGSVAAGLYCSQLLDPDVRDSMLGTAILNEDNLSPLIAAMFFREFIQSVIPVNIESLDRGRVMDETLERNWGRRHPAINPWKDDFMELWNHNTYVPSLFINTTQVETGKCAVISNLKIDSTEVPVIDVMNKVQGGMKLSQAIGLSARFPIVMPAGRFEREDGTLWGHLADGGYYENSGVATMYQIYLKLREETDRMKRDSTCPVIDFQLVLISNGAGKVTSEEELLLHELTTPVNALVNSWYTKGYSYANIAGATMSQFDPNDQFYELRLDRDKMKIPLGWFLSEASRREIGRQAAVLGENIQYTSFVRRMEH